MELNHLTTRLARALNGRERDFFDLLETSAALTVRTAELFDELLHFFPRHPEIAGEIRRCRRDAEDVTATLVRRLLGTFVTPVDREDLRELAMGLLDLACAVDDVADLLDRYPVQAPRPEAQRVAQHLARAGGPVATGVAALRGAEDVVEQIAELRRLHRDGSELVRSGLGALFGEDRRAVELVSWKDLFDRLDRALAACGRIASGLEAISIAQR